MTRHVTIKVVDRCVSGHTTPHWFPRLCVAYPMIKKLTVKCLHPVAVSVFLFVVNTCRKLESLCITIPAQIPELSSSIYCHRITKLILKGKTVSWANVCNIVQFFPKLAQLVVQAQIIEACPTGLLVAPYLNKLCLDKQTHMVHTPDLSGLVRLTWLCLGKCARLNSIDGLRSLPQLEYLDVTDCSSLTSLLVNQAVDLCRSLRSLYVSTPVTCELLKCSSQLLQLQLIVTGSCVCVPAHLFTASIAQHTQLEHLEIQHGCNFDHL
jgi:hypothetical protein